MDNKVQEFITKKKRKRLRKKLFVIFLLLISVTLAVLLKASFFNVNTIILNGNKVLDKNKILNEKEIIGQNIFLFNKSDLENLILSNPYIEKVTVKKNLPNKIDVKIEERKMVYQVKVGEKYYILNKSLVIMDIRDNVEGLSLLNLEGLKVENKNIGNSIIKDEGKIKIGEILGEKVLKEDKREIESLEINNINNIILKKGNIKIRLGDINKLEEKYSKALKILASSDLGIESGYIDVSFDGNPVIKEEKGNNEDIIENKNVN